MKNAWWCRSRSSRRRTRPSCSPGWPSCAGRRRPRTPQGCHWRQRSSSGGLPRQLVASCCRWRDCGISEWLTSLIKRRKRMVVARGVQPITGGRVIDYEMRGCVMAFYCGSNFCSTKFVFLLLSSILNLPRCLVSCRQVDSGISVRN